ncbi:MAG: M20 family metallo-hydrolase [Calditrichia bacterium]
MDETVFRNIEKKIESYRQEMIDFQKAITRIPALSPTSGGEGEWDKAMWIKNFLEKRGIQNIMQINAPDPTAKNGNRPNLIIRIPGKSSERTIWIMAHTDVVPEGDRKLWNTDPFEVVEKDGKLYGRGTEDNQQSLTSAVFTALAFHELNIPPEYDLDLMLVADEETGNKFGLSYLMEHHRDLFKKDDIILVPDAGEPDGSMIEVAEKGIVWIRFVTRGKQCHASLPDHGINAFRAASNLVVKLHRLYEIFDARSEVFDPPTSTFEPTKKEANVPNVNTIPGEDIFYLDCRLLPEYNTEQLLETVRKICDEVEAEFGVTISFDTTQKEDAAPATPVDAPVVQKLKRAIDQVYQIEARPMGIGGGTVAALFRRHGLPAAVWSKIDDVCHQPNEYCVIDNMVNDAKVFAHVCLQGE